MIREVCYYDEDCTPGDRLFQIVAFRTFSKIDTWRSVRSLLGHYPTLDDLASGAFARALDHSRAANGGLYTDAFIPCATNAYSQKLKHLNHVELFRHMVLAENLGKRLLDAQSLREVYDQLHDFPLMGDFMSTDHDRPQLLRIDQLLGERVHPGRPRRPARHQEMLHRPGRPQASGRHRMDGRQPERRDGAPGATL
jgi:5-hmdU DNA kinase, helical domain